MVTAVSSEGERARERVRRDPFSSMSSSSNRWEGDRDIAGTSLPLAFSCRDTGGRRRAIPLLVLGHVTQPGVLGPFGTCIWSSPAAEAPSCTFSRAWDWSWALVLGTTGQLDTGEQGTYGKGLSKEKFSGHKDCVEGNHGWLISWLAIRLG